MATAQKTREYIWGLGRRKSSVARVRICPGTGIISINGRDLEKYFHRESDRVAARMPLKVANLLGKFDAMANVNGGGATGQSGAVCLGIARALLASDPQLRGTLREHGLLTRDSRIKERKKYGLRGARRAPQFSKR